ncbi:hypothetical protein BDK51DRAFT_32963 [Blyttiomyces helicus]|uniref:Cyclin-domain-containing protein n=1 Tax=Blyttiomyces helicus TaxID=388810 RepID=A0A4P9WBU7_9FUNG|nr:hypothetical protein BDK51DRAFT_32963 [Blyttiomyces helicus]|eukprot:RKO89964.1 hypothetical protein BDK51DRAFT_32963 [Blyttiomyces helicus]
MPPRSLEHRVWNDPPISYFNESPATPPAPLPPVAPSTSPAAATPFSIQIPPPQASASSSMARSLSSSLPSDGFHFGSSTGGRRLRGDAQTSRSLPRKRTPSQRASPFNRVSNLVATLSRLMAQQPPHLLPVTAGGWLPIAQEVNLHASQGVHCYAKRLVANSRLSLQSILVALKYLDRFHHYQARAAGQFPPCAEEAEENYIYPTFIRAQVRTLEGPHSEAALLTAALMAANKFLDDGRYSNRWWSDVSGMPIAEIHAIETSFLTGIGYHLFVAEKEYIDWVHTMQKMARWLDGGEEILSLNDTAGERGGAGAGGGPSITRRSKSRTNLRLLSKTLSHSGTHPLASFPQPTLLPPYPPSQYTPSAPLASPVSAPTSPEHGTFDGVAALALSDFDFANRRKSYSVPNSPINGPASSSLHSLSPLDSYKNLSLSPNSRAWFPTPLVTPKGSPRLAANHGAQSRWDARTAATVAGVAAALRAVRLDRSDDDSEGSPDEGYDAPPPAAEPTWARNSPPVLERRVPSKPLPYLVPRAPIAPANPISQIPVKPMSIDDFMNQQNTLLQMFDGAMDMDVMC